MAQFRASVLIPRSSCWQQISSRRYEVRSCDKLPETQQNEYAELVFQDLTAASTTTIALPIVTLPHVITPSLALSVLSDLLPRLSHTHPAIRKKTIVTLYRLALVYPETLRAAWPKIKERLMDRTEDPSVTAAIINVICELGWRRPHDFLPLAPRLFELLVDSGNNWMAIKLIKLVGSIPSRSYLNIS